MKIKNIESKLAEVMQLYWYLIKPNNLLIINFRLLYNYYLINNGLKHKIIIIYFTT